MAGPQRPTFECGTTEIIVINVNRIHPHANRMYAHGQHPLTRHEQTVVRIMREVRCPAHIAGLNTLAIMLRMFAPDDTERNARPRGW